MGRDHGSLVLVLRGPRKREGEPGGRQGQKSAARMGC